MKLLVTRFHTLLLTVTVAITLVAFLRIPASFVYSAHWTRSTADWLWPRDLALLVAPLVQVLLLIAFLVMGRLFTSNQFAKSQHILDPALTLLMMIVAACQLGLLLTGMGSDLDLIRMIGFALGAVLIGLGAVLYSAERHTYAGLRMPWPIRTERAWTAVHRSTGLGFAVAGIALMAGAWRDAGQGLLIVGFVVAMVVPTLIAGALTLALSR